MWSRNSLNPILIVKATEPKDMILAFQDLNVDEFRFNVKFLEKKRNLIMSGDFVKLVYSDECMAVNSIFFACQIKCKYESDYSEKCTVWFSPYDAVNEGMVQRLIDYEQALLEEYIDQTRCVKRPMCLLKTQLLSGNLRLYKMHNIARAPSPKGGCGNEPVLHSIARAPSPKGGCGNEPVLHNIARAPSPKGGCPARREPTAMLVKISGVWESNEQFGITYKFIECCNL